MFSSPLLEKGSRFHSPVLGNCSRFSSAVLEMVLSFPVQYWERDLYVFLSSTWKRFLVPKTSTGKRLYSRFP